MLRLPHPPTMPCRALGTQCDVGVPALRCAVHVSLHAASCHAGRGCPPRPVPSSSLLPHAALRGAALLYRMVPNHTAPRCPAQPGAVTLRYIMLLCTVLH